MRVFYSAVSTVFLLIGGIGMFLGESEGVYLVIASAIYTTNSILLDISGTLKKGNPDARPNDGK